jgi:signal transduction histidine kinase
MNLQTAEHQKTFNAEKHIAYVRALVIIAGTITFFFLPEKNLKKDMAHVLLVIIWLYGAYVLYFKPYEKYPIFLASWFTYISDAFFATIWIYATGGFYSPYHVMLYTSIIAVAFRFNLETTLFTSALYTACYFCLLIWMDQLDGNFGLTMVRTSFIFVIGFFTYLITKETLSQTQEKILMKQLAEDAKKANELLAESQLRMEEMNQMLQLKNDIFNHAEENVMLGSYCWDLNSKKLEYSDNLYRILGEEPNSFIPSFEKYLSFIHPDDQHILKRNAEAIFKERRVTGDTYRAIVHGKMKFLRTTGRVIEEDRSAFMIGTVQDITEDVLMQEQLQLKNKELELMNQQLASFNYIASHDLQEPVRKIQIFSNYILEKNSGELTEATKNYIQRIASSGYRMQNLILAFLNYSKIESSEIVFERTDLNKLMEDVKFNLDDLIQEKNAVVEYHDLPAISAVPFQFQQLMVNLLSNAIKYSKPDETPHVKISADKVKGESINDAAANPSAEYWKISVSDNGIGFEQQYADKIFEVFQRLHSKDKYGGSGIGLAICKKVVVVHKGFIRAESLIGVGSVFTIFIPVTH